VEGEAGRTFRVRYRSRDEGTLERTVAGMTYDSVVEGARMTFERITVRPDQMGGVPCIRGLRIPVSTVVDMVADGMTTKEILDSYPDLREDDIREALRFAAEAVRERELPISAGA
jgi:uncharacterized protein (DUF433 family)